MRSLKDLRNTFCFGMHGCGYYRGVLKTNSKEAVKSWLMGGVYVMEIDISRTCDDNYVALAHNMTPKYLTRLGITKYSDKDVFTHHWFVNQKLCPQLTKGLTPLDLNSILDMMKEYEDMVVMFDLCGLCSEKEAGDFTKKLIQHVNNGAGVLLNRILVEAYNQPMIDGIRKYGSNDVNIIYCVEDSNPMVKHQVIAPNELTKQKVEFVSYPWTYLKKDVRKIEPFKNKGFTVFSVSKDNRHALAMKKVGVNVNLVDMRYHWWLFPYEILYYYLGRLRYHRSIK